MDTRSGDIYTEAVPALDSDTIRAAQRTVVAHVDDAEDCVLILSALGINRRL